MCFGYILIFYFIFIQFGQIKRIVSIDTKRNIISS